MKTHTLFLLLPLLALLLLAGGPPADDPVTLELGQSAPDFSLPGVDDRTYSLSDFADARVLAIIFTTNHCPTSQAYEDRLIQLHNDYKDQGVAVVAISPNDPESVRLDELGYTDLSDTLEEMKLRAEHKDFPFPYLYDGETQAASRAYGPVATPHAFVFDEERKLRYVGRIDNDESGQNITSQDTRDAIEALLNDQPVPVEETKTFGCSVKWADKQSSAEEALARWNQEDAELTAIGLDEVEAIVANDTENLRVINVWATWCGPCIVEFPELIKMHRMYRGREFELVTLNMDPPSKQEKVHAFLKKQAASTSNYIFNSDDRYAFIEAVDENWAGALPYTLVVAPGGEVVYSQMGEIDPIELRRAVADELGRTYFD